MLEIGLTVGVAILTSRTRLLALLRQLNVCFLHVGARARLAADASIGVIGVKLHWFSRSSSLRGASRRAGDCDALLMPSTSASFPDPRCRWGRPGFDRLIAHERPLKSIPTWGPRSADLEMLQGVRTAVGQVGSAASCQAGGRTLGAARNMRRAPFAFADGLVRLRLTSRQSQAARLIACPNDQSNGFPNARPAGCLYSCWSSG